MSTLSFDSRRSPVDVRTLSFPIHAENMLVPGFKPIPSKLLLKDFTIISVEGLGHLVTSY
jgi:hypothetical protein